MSEYIHKWFGQGADWLYLIARILLGIVFLLHGLMKFGIVDGKSSVTLLSLMGLAGVIEIVVGLLLITGLFVRLAALIGSIEMIIAWFMVHVSHGIWNPLANGGEPAVLFLAAFLVLLAYGAKKWSLDKALFHKEIF